MCFTLLTAFSQSTIWIGNPVFIDHAASMSGRVKWWITQIKINPTVSFREALASKRMSTELHDVLKDTEKVIHFIMSRLLNHRLIERLCDDSGTEHKQLRLHTDVRWLSRGKTLEAFWAAWGSKWFSVWLTPLCGCVRGHRLERLPCPSCWCVEQTEQSESNSAR